MRIKVARIRNFRSIHDLSITFGDLTRAVGANGSGKSTILNALDLFYAAGTPNMTKDDFFGRDDSQEIVIALTFTGFSAQEREMFRSRITDADEMIVSRIFTASGGRGNGKYYGVALRNPDFAGVRAVDGARDRLRAYKDLFARYPDLDQTITSGNNVEVAFQQWEHDHPGGCVPSRDDGQFFGFQNVGQGKLQAATSLVFVPAVRDASDDVAEGRGTPITVLMDLVVRSAIEAKPELRAFRENTEQRYKELTSAENLTELGTLGRDLTATLRSFYPDCGVLLSWQDTGPLQVPLPNAAIRLDDDGYATPVDRAGHGLQRALIMTLLQHLAAATLRQPTAPPPQGERETDPAIPAVAPSQAQPGVILVIEEPEVYQHPTKQRHLMRVLEALSCGRLPGVATNTQVVYCTHSPLFISMESFDQVRLVRRQRAGDDGRREAVLSSISLDQVARALEVAWRQPGGTYTADSLKPKLHVIDTSVAEGFFAAVAVIVEGVSDRAALHAAAALKGIDMEAEEIAVVVANGKNNIDKPLAVFRGLGIPAYAVWDCDEGTNDFNPRANHALLRLVGVPEAEIVDASDRVDTRYACFRTNLEATLQADISRDRYVRLLDALKDEYGVSTHGDAQKTPAIMRELLQRAAAEGARSATLSNIVDAILALKPSRTEAG